MSYPGPEYLGEGGKVLTLRSGCTGRRSVATHP